MHFVKKNAEFLNVKLGVTQRNSLALKGSKGVIVEDPINVAAEIQTIVHSQTKKQEFEELTLDPTLIYINLQSIYLHIHFEQR